MKNHVILTHCSQSIIQYSTIMRFIVYLALLTLISCEALARGAAYENNIYYISPNGSDKAPGTTPETAWQTFSYALSRLYPSDTLILLDGVYTRDTTGLLEVLPENSRNGERSTPITVKALNERQAIIDGEGYDMPINLFKKSFWVLEGLTARNGDRSLAEGAVGTEQHAVRIQNSQNIILKRLLAFWPNRFFNAQGILISQSNSILVERCEVYAFHRHGINAYLSENVTLRLNYVNSRNQPDRAGGSSIENGQTLQSPGGDEGLVFYGSSNSIMENNITENRTLGAQIHGTLGLGQNNKILGHISLDDYTSVWIDSREAGQGVANTYIKDVASINSEFFALGLYATPPSVLVENITIINARETALFLRQKAPCASIEQGCGFTLRNAAIYNSNILVKKDEDYPDDYIIDHSNFYQTTVIPSETIDDGAGNLQRSSRIDPNIEEPFVWVSENSSLKGMGRDGADIGANIIYRYENGTLTSETLWDSTTGAFPCGAILEGINDEEGCTSVHKRLGITPSLLAEVVEIQEKDNSRQR